jgi:hypothetical protein
LSLEAADRASGQSAQDHPQSQDLATVGQCPRLPVS